MAGRRVDKRIVNLVYALLSATLFFVAIGIDGWSCPGGIFSDFCQMFSTNQVTAPLLLVAGLLATTAAVFIVLVVKTNYKWAPISACVAAIAASVLGSAGVFYYIDSINAWSPFIATIAMAMAIAVSITLVIELVAK